MASSTPCASSGAAKVEYGLTVWGQPVCPALDALLECAGNAPKDVSLGLNTFCRVSQPQQPNAA